METLCEFLLQKVLLAFQRFGSISAQIPNIYMSSCACHLILAAAERASRQLCVTTEEYRNMIFHYLDKSIKRTATLRDIQRLCDTDVGKILKLATSRGLSLGRGINLLQQWDPLSVLFSDEAAASKLLQNSLTAPAST